MNNVKYICEASDNAIMLLYMLVGDKCAWEQNLYSFHLKDKGVYLGKDKENPNMLSLRFIRIDSVIICFYEGTSMNVDHGEITRYMDSCFPKLEDINIDTLAIRLKNRTLEGQA